jgi:predicted flap endonuclease-1-like 5' DNA nuclease
MIEKVEFPEKETGESTELDTTEQNNVIPHTSSSPSPTLADLEIQDIEGVGPTTAKKVKEAGIFL